MHQGLQFLDIIFLALIAGFLFLRLRNVLGRRTGHERPPTNPYPGPAPAPAGRDDALRQIPGPDDHIIVDAPPRPVRPFDAGLAQINRADADFNEAHFLEGAKSAYEMIVKGFADDDRPLLRDLLAPDVFERFNAVLDEREAKGQRAETTIVGVDSAKIVNAEMRGSLAEITVRFVSEIVSCVKDAEGNLIEGHPTAAHSVTDVWTFRRDTTSRDINWAVVATSGDG